MLFKKGVLLFVLVSGLPLIHCTQTITGSPTGTGITIKNTTGLNIVKVFISKNGSSSSDDEITIENVLNPGAIYNVPLKTTGIYSLCAYTDNPFSYYLMENIDTRNEKLVIAKINNAKIIQCGKICYKNGSTLNAILINRRISGASDWGENILSNFLPVNDSVTENWVNPGQYDILITSEEKDTVILENLTVQQGEKKYVNFTFSGKLRVVNNTPDTIKEVYFSKNNSTDWGNNQAIVNILPGLKFDFYQYPDGECKLKVVSHGKEYKYCIAEKVTLDKSDTYTWNVTTDDLNCYGSVVVINKATSQINGLFFKESSSSIWINNLLPYVLAPSDSFTIIKIEPGDYDFKISTTGNVAENQLRKVTITGCNLGRWVIRDSISSLPEIITQPSSITVREGQTATFTIFATGSNLTYQWQKDTVNISGAISALYTTPPLSIIDNGKSYRCVVNSDKGKLISVSAVLEVKQNVVNHPPVADAGSDTTVYVNGTIYLSGLKSTDDVKIVEYAWKIGTTNWGKASSKADTSFKAPSSAQVLPCSLRVKDNEGLYSYAVKHITIIAVPTFAVNAGNDTIVGIKDSVYLYASSNSPSAIIKYEWKIGTGVWRNTGSSDTIIIAPPKAQAEYLCSLRVTNADNAIATDVKNIIVETRAPVANAGNDTTVQKGDTVRFSAANSKDDGKIVEYAWKFPNALWFTCSKQDTSIKMDSIVKNFVCSLKVVDDDGNVQYDVKSINVTMAKWLVSDERHNNMVRIHSKGNGFMMGNANDVVARPVHQVTFTYDFFIDSTEVTQEDYMSIMGVNPSLFKGQSSLPVETINWFDAAYYCNQKSKKEGLDTVFEYSEIVGTIGNGCYLTKIRLNSKTGYRLPTEAEWEYACRAGTTTDRYWGDEDSTDYAWFLPHSDSMTHPVAQRLPNSYGLYDLNGNVSEWCLDTQNGYPSTQETDYYVFFVTLNENTARIFRGGDYSLFKGYSNYKLLTSYGRVSVRPAERDSKRGFRVVIKVPND